MFFLYHRYLKSYNNYGKSYEIVYTRLSKQKLFIRLLYIFILCYKLHAELVGCPFIKMTPINANYKSTLICHRNELMFGLTLIP